MLPNSSTSSSSYRAYLASLLVFTLLFCVLVFVLVSINRARHIHMPYEELYAYQMEKLKTAHDIDTVFLGDSSLGNAIDAKLWDQWTGKKSLNLALTSGYGYQGAYVMLENVLASGLTPKNAII